MTDFLYSKLLNFILLNFIIIKILLIDVEN